MLLEIIGEAPSALGGRFGSGESFFDDLVGRLDVLGEQVAGGLQSVTDVVHVLDRLVAGELRRRIKHRHIEREEIADGVQIFAPIEATEDGLTAGAGETHLGVGGELGEVGDDGGDLVYGNLGDDSCNGGNGNDTVRGGQGNDTLSGGAGADFVSGDRGDDTMTGGLGADIFHSSSDAGIDRVLDFNLAEGDRVQLDPGTTFSMSQVGADTVVQMSAGQVVLVGISMSALTAGSVFVG